jgi:hypothetical protein
VKLQNKTVKKFRAARERYLASQIPLAPFFKKKTPASQPRTHIFENLATPPRKNFFEKTPPRNRNLMKGLAAFIHLSRKLENLLKPFTKIDKNQQQLFLKNFSSYHFLLKLERRDQLY